MRVRILFEQDGNEARSEAGSGVHGEIDGDEPGGAHGGIVERLAGEVEAEDFVAGFAEPCGRRHEAKGLAAEFVG